MKKHIITALFLSIILCLSVGAVDYTSPDVIKQVQQALNDAGFDCGEPDGWAGAKTEKAISDYCQAYGLADTGKITDQLYSHLFRPLSRGELEEKYNLVFTENVNGDSSGKFRLSVYSSDAGLEEFADDYYNDMMVSPDETHAVINTNTNISYKVTTDDAYLYIDSFQHIENEESNASFLFSGSPIGSIVYNLNTKEIENPEETKTEKDAIDIYMEAMEEDLRDIYGDYFKLTRDGDIVTCGVWADGIGAGVAYAKLGYTDVIASYKSMKSGQEQSAKSFYDYLKVFDSNAHLVYSVLNDVDLEKAVLIWYDGEMIYDALNE